MSLKNGILLCLTLAFASGQITFADTLHGFCTSPTPACSDNGTITPTSTNPPTFGFASSGTTMGNFELIALVPSNEDVSPTTYSLTLTGTNVTTTPVISTLFSTTAFTAGKLEDYLGVSYTPSNPLSAFLPSTKAVDSGATGYYVYLFNFGAETGNPKKDSTAPTFSITSGTVDLGSVFLGLEFNGSTSIFTGNIFGATPPSAAIIENGHLVPEPTTTGLVGCVLLAVILAGKKLTAERKQGVN